MRYPHLFTPIKIGGMEVSNRMVVPAMGTNLANQDGTVSDRLLEYWKTRAEGGWGLLITGITAVDPLGKAGPIQVGMWKDDFISSLQVLTSTVHRYGARIAAQLHHAGRQTFSIAIGDQPVAPSPIPCPVCREMPRELSTGEVYELIEKFGDAAVRARRAGFDAVEVHGAHGYLVAQFMSPYANKRIDEFGGSFENLMRFPLEIVKNIRRKAGADFPVIFRISGEERVSGGRNLEESRMAARVLEDAGVDAFNVSVGVYASSQYIQAPPALPPGHLLPAGEEIKKAVSVPVITVGRMNHPLLAEEAISAGKTDLTAWGRQSLADPELPNKVAGDRQEDIVPCLSCTQRCIERVMQVKPVSCVVNPFCGKEAEMKLEPASESKKVVVVGGGPAGLEAAWVAAARGHRVVLFEKESQPGGQFKIAAVPPTKHEISKAVNYFIYRAKKEGVFFRCGELATKEKISEEAPDVVILATGGKPLVPGIEGVEGEHVVSAVEVLSGRAQLKGNVLVAGGGMVGCETADYLAERGCRVTLVEALSRVAGDVEEAVKYFLMKRLRNRRVNIITGAEIKSITEDGAVVQSGDREEKLEGYRSVVLALGVEPVSELEEQLQGAVEEMHRIGDALEPGKASDAISQGGRLALQI